VSRIRSVEKSPACTRGSALKTRVKENADKGPTRGRGLVQSGEWERRRRPVDLTNRKKRKSEWLKGTVKRREDRLIRIPGDQVTDWENRTKKETCKFGNPRQKIKWVALQLENS